MTHDATDSLDDMTAAMRLGDLDALAAVFDRYRERLRRIIRFRLDYRLAPRVSDSDVLQDAFLAASKRLGHFRQRQEMSAFLWLRLVTYQQMIDVHRRHLKVDKRDIKREVSIEGAYVSPHTSTAIAASLIGNQTAASELLMRAEQIEQLESVLACMDEIDREVIALRHFEELSNVEAAQVLRIDPSAASKRYLRAMSRLAHLMKDFSKTNHREPS